MIASMLVDITDLDNSKGLPHTLVSILASRLIELIYGVWGCARTRNNRQIPAMLPSNETSAASAPKRPITGDGLCGVAPSLADKVL